MSEDCKLNVKSLNSLITFRLKTSGANKLYEPNKTWIIRYFRLLCFCRFVLGNISCKRHIVSYANYSDKTIFFCGTPTWNQWMSDYWLWIHSSKTFRDIRTKKYDGWWRLGPGCGSGLRSSESDRREIPDLDMTFKTPYTILKKNVSIQPELINPLKMSLHAFKIIFF